MHTGQGKLTKSSLLNLLCRKSESREQFHYYLHQNFLQGLRKSDLSIDTEPAEELLEGREQIYECVVTSANVFNRLRDSVITEIYGREQRMRDIRRVGWRCQRISLSRVGTAEE